MNTFNDHFPDIGRMVAFYKCVKQYLAVNVNIIGGICELISNPYDFKKWIDILRVFRYSVIQMF